ncbi:MarR family winged helix-turn-helix transcriptional regulator [Alicyclobacillus sp. SO9]|uniref:MarR family winged helix-turn-helix transcriptional regulator n=1 Tax=Alicyclobacillus sp. SO9 TaxID=2665646 RepID=UPI0018E76B70|nr:MarR family transcriptional regulator [Alicyclobacillus sp. SO9]QQE81023.1 MarR family transcriptional regulator [Alicyclobacillus sp. SO9]
MTNVKKHPGRPKAGQAETLPLGTADANRDNSKPTADELAAQLDDILPTVASRLLHFIRVVPGTEITRVQEFLLRHLHAQGPCTASTIGSMLGITSGPVTSLTKRLIEKGLIARYNDTEDGRIHWFRLTPSGVELVQQVASYRRTEWKRLVEKLGETVQPKAWL